MSVFNDISLLGTKIVFLFPRIRPFLYFKNKNFIQNSKKERKKAREKGEGEKIKEERGKEGGRKEEFWLRTSSKNYVF